MKLEDQIGGAAGSVTGGGGDEVMFSDVRWTVERRSSGHNSGRRRKSAKCSSNRVSRKIVEGEEVAASSPEAFLQSCPLPAMPCPEASGSGNSTEQASSSRSSSAWRSTPSRRLWWWNRCSSALVLYIVGVVLVGAIPTIHCDAVSSGSSNSVNSNSSLNQKGDKVVVDGGLHLVSSSENVAVEQDPFVSGSVSVCEDHYEGSGHYTHHWAVHIPDGGVETAEQVADEHGFINHGKIFDGYYHFEHRHVQKRSLNPSGHHQQRLDGDDRVRWAKQQRAKRRPKRDFRSLKSPYTIQLNDPKWGEMWYLNRGNGLDMNVIPAWKEGVTGKGVVVTILDDGLESDHPDLEHNYDPKASYDVNGNDGDPMPHYDLTDSNRHGTRCAGEVAATANNSKCAVGIAYGARVGGVRMLDGDVTDVVEAKSLGLNSQHIDIYSASWGPDDDGKTVDGPGDMATRAFIEGVRKGRGGKGSIFIWASGNGGREHDNCNCDGYTNSIWTLSISSASQEGLVPWFSEMCSSTLATTYSSGNTNEKQVITTDLHHSCTSSHTGTSASAPLAAGIAALVLEANPNLTWRDLQHVVVRTAKPGNLKDPTWSKNGVGRRVSHSFGYGLMDAAAMVKLARTWKTVPEQQICEINAPHLDKQIPPRTKVTLQLVVEHCKGVNYLEHVQAKITLTSQRRGDIQIFLTSPSGTRVTLLTPRSHDLSRSGFNQWPFMSVHTWGEAPHGTWQLEIHNEGRLLGYSLIRGWSLILYGTSSAPDPNDPPNVPRVLSTPQPVLPPIIPASGYTGYSVGGGSKNFYTSGGGGIGKPNRKQQLQYATYTPAASQFGMTTVYQSPPATATSSRKNKNKNKPNKNSSKTTTARPNGGGNGQTTLNVFVNSYGKKFDSYASGKKTQTSKPKPPSSQNSNFNRNEKFNAASSTIYEKQVAIKAPKQVKDSNSQTPSRASSRKPISITSTTNLPSSPVAGGGSTSTGTTSLTTQSPFFNERFSTTNARIPKLFQQYEKIQQFYPELKPYSSIRDDLDRPQPSNNHPSQLKPSSIFLASSVNASGTNATGTSTSTGSSSSSYNGKPSRANTKIFFPDTDIIDAIGPRKISSSLQPIQPFYGRTQSSQFVSSGAKSGKAQITHWNLIFYGTETPAQPDDPVRLGKPGFSDSNYGGEIEHNSLEFDNGITSDQWRNMQQIGESHVDVQRTASSDVTASVCANYSGALCIDCGTSSYSYKGRCYSTCPDSTYPSDPSSGGAPNRTDEDTIKESAFIEQQPLPKGSLRRSSTAAAAIAFQLVDDDDDVGGDDDNSNNLGNDALVKPSPQERDTQPHEQQQQQQDQSLNRQCIQCHPTCLKCFGPDEFHCTECQPLFAFVDEDNGANDVNASRPSSDQRQRHCVSITGKQRPGGTNKSRPNATLSYPAAADGQQKSDKSWQSSDYLIMIAAVGATLLVAFAVIYLMWRRCFRGVLLLGSGSGSGGTGDYQYDRVRTEEAISSATGEPSYAELVRDEIDDILAESSSDESGGSFMATRIIAPLER